MPGGNAADPRQDHEGHKYHADGRPAVRALRFRLRHRGYHFRRNPPAERGQGEQAANQNQKTLRHTSTLRSLPRMRKVRAYQAQPEYAIYNSRGELESLSEGSRR